MLGFPQIFVNAQPFQLDFGSVQTGVLELSGGDRILEGGLTPLQAHGVAGTAEVVPLGAMDLASQSSGASSAAVQQISSAAPASDGPRGGGRGARVSVTPKTIQKTQIPRTPGAPAGTKRGIPGSVPPRAKQKQEPPRTPGAPAGAKKPAPRKKVPESILRPPAGSVADTESPTPLHAGASAPLSPGDQAGIEGRPESGVSPGRLSPAFMAKALSSGGSVPAYAMGSVALAQAGILARLGWIAHIKNLYAAIPAYESASVPFSGLLSAMRPGSVSVSALAPVFVFPVRRKRRRTSPDILS